MTEEYQKDSSYLGQVVAESMEKELKDISFPMQQKIRLFVFISYSRLRNNFYLENEIEQIDIKNPSLPNKELERFYQKILVEFKYLKNNTPEKTFFINYISTLDLIELGEFSPMDFRKFKINDRAHEQTTLWIRQFIDYFSIDLTAESHFFLSINLYYQFFRGDLLEGAALYNLGSQGAVKILARDNDDVWVCTNKFLMFLKKINLEYSPVMRATFYLLIREVLFVSKKKIKICVLSSLSQSQRKNIEIKIKKNTDVPIEFHEEMSNKIDFVIADFYLENEVTNRHYLKYKMIFTNTFPSLKDYEKINKELLGKYHQKLQKNNW